MNEPLNLQAWGTFIGLIGIPGAIALYLVWILVNKIDKRLEKIETKMDKFIETINNLNNNMFKLFDKMTDHLVREQKVFDSLEYKYQEPKTETPFETPIRK